MEGEEEEEEEQEVPPPVATKPTVKPQPQQVRIPYNPNLISTPLQHQGMSHYRLYSQDYTCMSQPLLLLRLIMTRPRSGDTRED